MALATWPVLASVISPSALIPGGPEVGHDLLDHLFAFPVGAVDPYPAEAADREFVNVQDDDVISAVVRELAGHVRGCYDMPGRIMCCGVNRQQDVLAHVSSFLSG